MLLAYVDESYVTDKFFGLGAVLVDGVSAGIIEEGLDGLVAEWSQVAGSNLPADAELHGHEIFQQKGAWSALSTRQRINIYVRALEIIGTSGAEVILRGMDVVAQHKRYVRPLPPHDVVLGHLLESVDRRASDRGQRVVMVADEVHTQDRHRTNFRSYRTTGTPGYQSSRLPAMLDTLHFGPSCHSRLLQASDLVTFAWRRRETIRERDARAQTAMDLMWDAITPAVKVNWVWRP